MRFAAAVPETCPLCRRVFADHVALRALCTARWRGASFDAAQARANVGLAVMDALGLDPRDRAAVARFTREVAVESHRTARDPNPPAAFDPTGEPEWWEFHVGFVTPVAADVRERAAAGALMALARSRGFASAAPANPGP